MSAVEMLRETADLMRGQHGPDHPRHEMWAAMADLLEAHADGWDTGPYSVSQDDCALAVVRAYPHPSTDPDG